MIKMVEMLRQGIAQLPFFRDLTGDQLARIQPLLTEERFHAGQVVFDQGHAASRLYILVEGQVVIRYKPYDGPPLDVTHVPPGGVFGWSAALQRQNYTSAAVAETDSTAYCLSTDALQSLCCQDPQAGAVLLEHLAAVIAERLRATHAQILGLLTQGLDANGDCGKGETP